MPMDGQMNGLYMNKARIASEVEDLKLWTLFVKTMNLVQMYHMAVLTQDPDLYR